MKRVLVARKIHQAGLTLLQQSPNIEVVTVEQTNHPDFFHHLATANAVILYFQPLTAVAIEQASCLEFVSRHGVGYDAVDLEALKSRAIPLAITPQANVISVAEHAVSLALSVAKRLMVLDSDVKSGLWQNKSHLPLIELSGKLALIVGAGRIGYATAQRLESLGMQIAMHDVSPVALEEAKHRGWLTSSVLSDVLGHADLVSVHVPLSEATRGLIQPLEMKADSILVNTARGGVVDAKTLEQALREGHLAGAGLDVYENEPINAACELLKCPNLIATPHVAALTDGAMVRMAIDAAQNVLDFFADQLDPSVLVSK